MRLAILAFRSAQRPHAPHVCVAVDAVPCAVEKDREALLLLLCADKVRLVATFLRRATNEDPECDHGRDGNQESEPMRNPLDQSQNNLHGATPCMALADPRENRRPCRRINRLLIRCTSRAQITRFLLWRVSYVSGGYGSKPEKVHASKCFPLC